MNRRRKPGDASVRERLALIKAARNAAFKQVKTGDPARLGKRWLTRNVLLGCK